MKNKYILSAVLVTLFASVAANAQQGFGTNNPDPSSVIDMVSAKRGVLIPRLALTATNVATPVTAPAEALLVYNEATAGSDPYDVKPGFYYWSVNRWIRITNIEDITKGTISSTDLTVTGGTDATFKNVTLEIKDGAVTEDKIASEAVTEDKMKAPEITGTAIIRIPIAQNDGTVAYGPFPAAGVVGDNLTAAADTVESIEVVTGGTGAVLVPTSLRVKDGGITEVKLADGAVTTAKIGADAVTNAKLADNAVQTENIAAGAVETSDIKDAAVTTVKIEDAAVTAVKLADDAVTAAKIDSSVAGTGLKQNTTNGSLEVDAASFDGDITSTDLTVTGGDNATFTDVTLDIKADAVTNAKLADNAVQTENIKDGNVTSAKLTAGAGVADRIAIADAAGAVTFSNAIPSGSIAGEDLTAGDGSISIGGTGAGALLKDANVSVATGGITEVKLADGAVTTAKIGADAVTNAKLADNAVQTENIAAGAVETSDIKDAAVTTVKIEDAAVTAVKLADDAVTAAKIDSSVAGTGLKQNTTNGSLEVDAASFDGDITSTDLTVTGGDNATFTDVTLDIKADAVTNAKLADNAVQTENIKDGNVTSAKLTAGAGTADRIAIADAAGAVTFSNAIPSGSIAGKDLTAGDGSISIGGTGAGALLKDANVSVATGGITEVKLADGAVTTAKIGADAVTNAKLADNAVQTENIAAGAVETSDIKDAAVTAVKLADDAVTAAKIDSSVAGTGLKQNTTNGSLEVDAASFDGDITSTDLTVTGGDNATFTDVTLDIKDGAVTTDKIKDGNVTSAKLTAGAGTADRIAIADAAGAVTFSNAIPSGSIAGEDLTAGDGSISIGGTGAGALLKDANVSVATGGITEVKLADGAVTTAKIGADAVTNAKLADNAVQTENIAAGAVETSDIKDAAVTAVKLADDAVTAAKIDSSVAGTGLKQNTTNGSLEVDAASFDGDITSTDLTVTGGDNATFTDVTLDIKADAVTNAKLADNAVQTENIAAGAVETSDIKDGNVTSAKLTAGAGTADRIAIADAAGAVTFSNAIPSGSIAGKDLTAGDGSISIGGTGAGALLKDANVSVATGGITEVKLADGAVTTAKIGADAVTNAKLADNAVQTENIAAGAVETSDIKDAAVTAVKLADDAVTAAKIDSSVAGTGLKQNTTNGSLEVDAASFDGDITSTDLTVTGGDNATFTDVTLDIKADAVTNAKLADNAVQTENIAAGAVETSDIKDGNVTSAKLTAGAGTADRIAIADAAGAVTFSNAIPSGSIAGKDLTAGDGSISIGGTGAGALLKDANVSVATGGITEVKLADGAVTTAKIGADAVTNAKLADNAVQTENIKDRAATAIKLNSGAATSGQVATANGTGGVTYQSLTPSMIGTAGEDLTAADGSLEVVTGGTDAVLVASSLQVKAGGISTAKLADGAVTNVKLGADAVTTDKIAAGAVETSDLASDAVTNAKLADNAVQTENIAAGAVETSDLASDAVTNAKLADNAVQTENIKDGAATAIKLNSGAATNGQVATANGTGGVTYQNITPSMIGTAGENLTAADSSLEVVTGGTDAVLVASSLQVKAGGISTAKLADGAVTNVKLGADAVTTDKIAAGAVGTSDLASDAVTNAKLADDAVQTENIKDGAATAIKLNSGAATSGQVATANGTGGVTYQSLTPSMIGTAGENLTAADASLEVVTGGTDAVLVASSLQVKAGGISTAKLADGAVTNVKLGADAVTTDKIAAGAVGTSDLASDAVTNAKLADDAVQTENIKDGAATAIKLNSGAATSGQVATANGTGGVTYQSLTPSMIGTAGENLTAADGSLEVVTGGTDAVLVASSLQVKAGGISTAKLADGAVTNVKLGADAVTTDKIAAGAVGTSDLASDAVTNAKLADDAVQTENIKDGAATAIKLNSGAATSGQVATANGTGGVTYQSLTPSMIGTAGENLTAADGSLEVVTGGTDAVLVASSLQVKAGGISTAKLADDAVTTSKLGADAVTNSKLADNAVQTENIAAGAVETSDIKDANVTTAKMAPGANDSVMTTNTSGTVEWTDKKTFVSEPWKVQNTTDPATSNSQSIYQQGNVGIGFSSTDAASAHALDVKAGTVRVREVRNNYTPVNTDKVVVADSNGVLRTVNAAMPRVFYMPAVIFDTSSPAIGLKRNLYLEYKAQFTGVTFIPNTTTGGSLGGANTGFVKSAGADATIPISVTNTDLMYYITYFDPAVFANLSIDANGILTYDIIGSGTEASYMNIVFVVK